MGWGGWYGGGCLMRQVMQASFLAFEAHSSATQSASLPPLVMASLLRSRASDVDMRRFSQEFADAIQRSIMFGVQPSVLMGSLTMPRWLEVQVLRATLCGWA